MAFRSNLKETPVYAGTYLAEVISVREITTKSGHPMVFVDWELRAGPDVGRIVSQGIAFVPQMVSRNNHLLKAMGQPFGEDLTVEPTRWIGVQARVKVALDATGSTVVDLAPTTPGGLTDQKPAADDQDTPGDAFSA